MVPRRLSFDDWEAVQRAKDPDWDKHVREVGRIRGPKRKIPLFCDANLESEFVEELRNTKYFRVTVARPGASDEEIWRDARRNQSIIVTGDEDFWNDRRFPLAQSPGVIFVTGGTAEQRLLSFVSVLADFDVVDNYRNLDGFLERVKFRGSAEGASGKYWDGEVVVLLG